MIRSILESCGYGLRQLCEITQSTTGSNITKFKSVGGGAKSKVWAQIKADITGKDIDILDCKDAASVGAALLAGVGCKIYCNLQEARNKVQKKVYMLKLKAIQKMILYMNQSMKFTMIYILE